MWVSWLQYYTKNMHATKTVTWHYLCHLYIMMKYLCSRALESLFGSERVDSAVRLLVVVSSSSAALGSVGGAGEDTAVELLAVVVDPLPKQGWSPDFVLGKIEDMIARVLAWHLGDFRGLSSKHLSNIKHNTFLLPLKNNCMDSSFS